mmetsp:Transcript_10751/g.29944  ORF Transcript_10751/g.29944 Transcript_10751/m.29944 type:complete len:1698 (-) Transcript_10751:367-5460(-)
MSSAAVHQLSHKSTPQLVDAQGGATGQSGGGDAGVAASSNADPFMMGEQTSIPAASPTEAPYPGGTEAPRPLDAVGPCGDGPAGDSKASAPAGPSVLASAWGNQASRATLRASGSLASSLEDDDDEALENQPWCWACKQHCGKGKGGWCYWLFVLSFLSMLFLFPLFLKWMITVPMPLEYWNQLFPEFPVLSDQTFVQEQKVSGYSVDISPIPTTWSGCNHTCGAAGGFLQTSEMNFQVDMSLEAPGYDHTVYPVLFASNDFQKWWLAADRRHAEPQPYFAGVSSDDVGHRYVTEQCTHPHHLDDTTTTSGTASAPSMDTYATSPTYVLVCVAWDVEKLRLHEEAEDAENYDLSKEDLATMCNAVGGVAGWPCGKNPGAAALPGVRADGVIQVDPPSGTVAGVLVNNSHFEGAASIHACLSSPDHAECVASTLRMSDWPCQQCVDVEEKQCEPGPQCLQTDRKPIVTLNMYDSYPQLEIQLKGMPTDEVRRGSVPRAFVMTSPLHYAGQEAWGPWGLTDGGTWRKLYEPHKYYVDNSNNELERAPPRPYAAYLAELEGDSGEPEYTEDAGSESRRLAASAGEVMGELAGSLAQSSRRLSRTDPSTRDDEEEEEAMSDQPEDTTPYVPEVDKARNKMEFYQRNRVSLQPSWCFGERGPLYLVACAANESTFAGGFSLGEGQAIAPPPFNDRCLAVSGRCAYACMEQQSPGIKYCDASGRIDWSMLTENFEPPSNSGVEVNIFIWMLLFGFAVKVVTFFPGLFVPYKAARYYEQQQTDQFKYISVVCPTSSETKACVLRNLVGAISSMPSSCRCPFNVVVMDEGHRHPQKVMFRAFAEVLDKIPDAKFGSGKGSRSSRDLASKESHKEKNVRAFAKEWVDLTRNCKLDDCNTEEIAKIIKGLSSADDSDGEIKKLNGKLDNLCGKKALQVLQERSGWPKCKDSSGAVNPEIEQLEAAIVQLRRELVVGEKTFDTCYENAKPVHLDDCEARAWVPKATSDNKMPNPLYILHYVARAKPDEDERTLKTQHVARGCWYYKVPMDDEKRGQKSWLDWRRGAREYEDGDFDANRYIVPVSTSRGKAGGLNFVENYLFHYYLKVEERNPVLDDATGEVKMQIRPSLLSIADARHQYQPNFFHETLPFFFLKGQAQVNPWVAFTQSPPFFPEQEDEQDYLDSNNSNFFRLHCMLRNCCGGVSSKGTNGTWLIKDRRMGIKGTSSIWDMSSKKKTRGNFHELVEHRFFRESCKVEDLATSLDVMVQGKHSQYINRRLSYGMAKDPIHYLAGVQRQTEGGVVLALQTFFRKKEGTPMVWMAFCVFTLFVASLANLMYGQGTRGFIRMLGSESGLEGALDLARGQADWLIQQGLAASTEQEAWTTVILDTQIWVALVLGFLLLLVLSSSLSYVLHHCTCGGKRRKVRRTRFPTSMAQWARLLILLDSLTYYLWFWTAFFWIALNYYTVFQQRTYHFEAKPMTFFSWALQFLSWAMVIFATARYRMDQSMQANEVFFLSLTNLWRTTQLFYITAPLTLFSIATGCGEFSRHRMLGVDISYWSAGDRGSISTTITKWWTLLLMFGAIAVNIIYWFDLLSFVDPISVLIVSVIGLDVVHICAFLWLGNKNEALPKPPPSSLPNWQWCIARFFQLLFSMNFYRNSLRGLVFSSNFVLLLQWVGPLQHVVFPLLIPFKPELGVNQALLLLIAGK